LNDKLPSGSFLKTLVTEKPEIIVDSILGSTNKMLNQKTLLKNVLLIRSVVDKPDIYTTSIATIRKVIQRKHINRNGST